MKSITQLREAINSFIDAHGSKPAIKISKAYWEDNASEIAMLSKEGYDIVVTEELESRKSFHVGPSPNLYPTVNTLNDLKEQVDRLIEEGKGHWPVKYLPHDANCYLQIKLCPIIPGNAPFEGLELMSGFADAPEGEHILMLVGNTE
ncbi:hypothetical protein [Fodinibius sediminis]|uniref:Uncharacterized protein n=1 Tax=Fodinibius sediminis TaxID=1214077 RepID=A0A521DNE7_9BACT|nr:hypothetical protein [Fodinibius sediminis]SMO72460.1 hypothetical protein SAMN06265218_1115 [Fodinibius sediminis]